MQELTMNEIEDVSGGKMAWLLILNAASDFFEGFYDGYNASR